MNLNERHSRWFDAFPRICQSNSIVVKGDFPTSHVWVPEGRPIISYYSPLLHSHCFFHVRRMTDRMEQEISETALSNHVVHPSQGDWSTENWRSFVKAYITWLDMCIYSCIYSYVCIHLPIWCDSDYIVIYYFIYIYLGGVDTRNFLRLIFGVSCGTMLWRGIWSLNRCCPMPARCPAGNRDLGARKKRLKSVFGTCLFLPDIRFLRAK